jgi:transposase
MTGNSAINNFLSLTCTNIVSKLWQVEVFMGQGMSGLDAIRQIGVVAQTYYRWRKQYGGMGVDQLKQLKRLEKKMSV